MTTYREQYKDPRWQKKRLEVMQEANWECENCGDAGTTLNVHHKRYIKGRAVWEYSREELACLCETCHAQEHDDRDLLARIIAEAGAGGLEQIIGLAVGYLDANCGIDPGVARMGKEGRELYYELGMAAAALEWLGMSEWRGVVRRVVAERPHTPSVGGQVREWDEKEGK